MIIYAVEKRTATGRNVIAVRAKKNLRYHVFGPGFDYAELHTEAAHRASYTFEDAQIVCDWLNQRARGYNLANMS